MNVEEAVLPPGVVRTKRGLSLWDDWRPEEQGWLFYVAQSFAVVAFPLGWIGTFFFESPVAPLVGVLAPMALVAGFVLWLSRTGVAVRFGPGAVVRGGVRRTVGTLTVAGEPGLPLRIETDGAPVLVLERGWSVAQTNAFVQALAASTPTVDTRDRYLWERWEHDPDFRASIELERELAANLSAFPALASVPELPVPEEASLDARVLRLPLRARGATASVRLCRAFLRAPGGKVRRERVRRAFVHFVDGMGGRLANVFVWDGRRSLLLGQVAVDSRWTAGRLKGLVRAIEEWARQREGTAADVPQELAALVAR